MSEQNRRQRRKHKKLRKGNAFARAVHAFNRVRDVAFPVTYHLDVRGRRRPVGLAARANARQCLLALMTVQKRGSWKRVYLGYDALGRQFDRSRSTAYRAVALLEAARLITAPVRKGGKALDEWGNVVPRANGYELHPDLVEGQDEDAPPPRAPRRPQQPGMGRRGQELVADMLERRERHRERVRAGPAA